DAYGSTTITATVQAAGVTFNGRITGISTGVDVLGGIFTDVIGINISNEFEGPTVNRAVGIYIGAPNMAGASTVNNVYGLYMEDQTGAGSHGGVNSNPWAIYSLGGQSYHAGDFSFGGHLNTEQYTS